MNVSIIKCQTGDWEGIYVDGILYRQDHELAYRDGFEVLNIKYDVYYVSEEELDQKYHGRLPKLLKDFKP